MTPGSKDRVSRAVLWLSAAGPAAYATTWLWSARATVFDRGFRPALLLAAVFSALGAAAFFLLYRAFRPSENSASGTGAAARLWPLGFLGFAPFLTIEYFDRADFQHRLLLLGLFAAAAAVYLFAARPPTGGVPLFRPLGRLFARFLAWPLKKRLIVLFLVAFLVYNACALVLVLEGVTFSGDEPNYLITTHSLATDGDINLADNFRDRDYFHFYDERDNPRLRMSPYAREGKKGRDFIYPINLPGISALMVPHYLAGQAVSGTLRTFILKGSLSLWAVLLGLQIYLLARQLWKKEGLALGLWAVYAFTTPVLFYAVHLYPEIPIALFSVFIYRRSRSDRPVPPLLLAFMGLLLGSFFWFGLKYNMIFWPLLAVAIAYLWPKIRPRARLLLLVVPALAGLALFYLSVWTMYGTLSPFAVYEGVLQPGQSQAIAQSFLDLPTTSRVETLLDYFLDQRDGLWLYAPFWIFMIPGFIVMFRKGTKVRRDLLGLLLISGPFVLNYAFFTHRQGFCPQGRVLAPVSWVAVIALGYFLDAGGRRIFRWLFGLGTAAAGAVSWILLRHPDFLYQPTTHDYTTRAGDLFVALGHVRLFLPPHLPSFLKVDNSEYTPNFVWVGLVVLFLGAWLVFGKKPGRPLSGRFHGAAAAVLLGAGIIFWVLFPRVPLSPSWAVRYSTGGSLGFYLKPMGRGVVARGDGEMYLHFEKSYRFVFASREKIDRLRLAFGSKKGEHEIRLRYFDAALPAPGLASAENGRETVVRTNREIRKTVFHPEPFYRLKGLYLYEIELTLEKRSDENLLDEPYLLQIAPVRR